MGNKITDELITAVRSVICNDFTDMDIIRALHMGNNDVTAAINIIFDMPNFGNKERIDARRSPEVSSRNSKPEMNVSVTPERIRNESRDCSLGSELSGARNCSMPECTLESAEPVRLQPSASNCTEWWFVGSAELAALSTCKGRKLKAGDEVIFSFPSKQSKSPSTAKFPGRGRVAAACSEIVRFSTKDSVEIGRIPNEWARRLLPLVNDRKIRIEGCCKFAPDVLSIMDTILLSVSVYINSSVFRKHHHISVKLARNFNEESVVHPLPTLFRLLGLVPFKKAEFTPEELYTRKRPLESKDSSVVHASLFHADKSKKPAVHGSIVENNQESISNSDLENIVGVGDTSELEERDPPNTLLCELRPYQKQALHWMIQLEKGGCLEEAAATMMHPCWDAYYLGNRRDLVVYLNAFSGEATTEFPSTLQMSRGGILADAMGLGKTIMTIALLLAYSDRGASSSNHPMSQVSTENSEVSSASDGSPSDSKKVTKFSGFDKLMKSRTSLIGGGNLIVCPMTLLGQWKAEIESHAKPGSLSIYVHYGQSRPKDTKLLAENDVVLTTYGVLASEYSAENAESSGGLYSVRWFRVVLDEAHTIKSSKSQISIAVAALTADRRWCLTGTPIQNSLEDIYSLLRFLKVEPWGNWAWWYKLVQKPFEEGDERGLKLVQSVLRPIMLRRTKFTTDREGRPILVLPPADVQVIYCELTAAEKDFYEALFKRSKVKFDQFVEGGRILHNYASILELLLRLRQCCDHPFLVMSRGDTQEFSDLNKLAKRFLKGGEDTPEVPKNVPSRAYIQEVVEELRKGEKGECPICLEAFEDAVLTPCAHRLCRECLLGSWRSPTSGLCPV
ncbi:DNA repair protein RAD5A isoform X2 [Telopea speciosissima]|nr:DNA repair protein RAD5A isoform X2 [Telopea speciosissima]